MRTVQFCGPQGPPVSDIMEELTAKMYAICAWTIQPLALAGWWSLVTPSLFRYPTQSYGFVQSAPHAPSEMSPSLLGAP